MNRCWLKETALFMAQIEVLWIKQWKGPLTCTAVHRQRRHLDAATLFRIGERGQILVSSCRCVCWSKSAFVVSAVTNFRTLYIQFSSACFCRFWLSTDRLYNNMPEKEYRPGGLPFTVSLLKYIKILDYSFLKGNNKT